MDWQLIAVFLIVALAAAYLVRRSLKRGTGCGGCDTGCHAPTSDEPRTSGLVQLELKPPPSPRRD